MCDREKVGLELFGLGFREGNMGIEEYFDVWFREQRGDQDEGLGFRFQVSGFDKQIGEKEK